MYVHNILYTYYMKKKTVIGIYFRNKEIILLLLYYVGILYERKKAVYMQQIQNNIFTVSLIKLLKLYLR